MNAGQKIKLGTIFSGIGAIERAFKRMNINHEILFACDNGDRIVNLDYTELFKKVQNLKTPIEKCSFVDYVYSKNTKKHNFVEDSYKANYKISNNLFFQDVKLFDGTDFRNELDFFVGGSPCQSFSIAGKRGGFEDTRGTLFYEFARLVREIRPKVFLYENVFGVLNHDHGKTWEVMKNTFNDLGYCFKWEVLNSKDYGIPQSRKRLFVVGFADNLFCDRFEFPKGFALKFTMQDFLLDYVKFGNFTSNEEGNIILKKENGTINEKLYLSEKLVKYVLSPGTKNFYHPNDTEINLPIARAILSTQGNTHRASVNNYTVTNNRIRALDPRESLRLMGFDDSFKIVVSKSQSYKQSGNSIVVDVLINIVKKIMETNVWSE